MPAIKQEARENPDPAVPGDRCYVFYKELMEMWRESPRWTTVDRILETLMNFLNGDVNNASRRAAILAFLVFFCREVMPYEESKFKENGAI